MVRGVYEYTDTFVGEPNYCWVKRGTVDERDCWGIIRTVRKKVSLTGVRGRVRYYDDTYEFKPYRMNTILFITFE